MKSWLLMSDALCVTGLSLAQTPAQGVVLSTTPIVQQVPVSRQVCHREQLLVLQPKSGSGPHHPGPHRR